MTQASHIAAREVLIDLLQKAQNIEMEELVELALFGGCAEWGREAALWRALGDMIADRTVRYCGHGVLVFSGEMPVEA